MSATREQPQRFLVVRRFEGEPLELADAVPPAHSGPSAKNRDDTTCQVFASSEDDMTIYHVRLPRHLVIRPPDWRRFAYDHDAVRRRVSVCVADNVRPLPFEPQTEDLRDSAERLLKMALRDLSSIFDTTSVACRLAPDGVLTIHVEGEFKNGAAESFDIAAGPPG